MNSLENEVKSLKDTVNSLPKCSDNVEVISVIEDSQKFLSVKYDELINECKNIML